uniref:SJCHGC02026 protein n=1 Tax=Schistosoma japonicum TaxID=6182 RepID=Q5BTC5_SCHJA|nr:SJCHGC02026 protein [Schistosoma japonicum]
MGTTDYPGRRAHGFSFSLKDLLNCLLLIAPDTTTFWNYKRQSLQNNKLSSSCEIKIHSVNPK